MVPPTLANDVSSSMNQYCMYQTRNATKVLKKARPLESKNSNGMSRNAARERYRVKSLRNAFHTLQQCLPSVPPNTKLSKLDVLILATTYISHLSRILNENEMPQESIMMPNIDFDVPDDSYAQLPENEAISPRWAKSYFHPIRKWPMRSRLYAGVEENNSSKEPISPPMLQQSLNSWMM
ncbi:transcription factor 23-like isoform X2 [Parasteatoda tepidariorum]